METLYSSNGGKFNLIKSALASLPTYFNSIFSMPTLVEKLDMLQRKSLQGGMSTTEKFKYHFVSWEMVRTPIEYVRNRKIPTA